ncbi:hypothetical protein A33Q_2240 [Indibacter alkaliphilus LW1]|uniref:Uncharacterized protein n=1 Tax=Indibacter alkaliphilus (strain CCUG 57479 / KCTC 22604 / LW1) TaxID=1189612 RepID=S2DH68_INDAL|nr:hypothetical protein A33Q_2240 [Indibacter alkaliphilus LW1]
MSLVKKGNPEMDSPFFIILPKDCRQRVLFLGISKVCKCLSGTIPDQVLKIAYLCPLI